MKIKLNSDTEIVNTIKEGLKKRMILSVCVRSSRRRMPILILKAFAIVCSITRKSNINIEF